MQEALKKQLQQRLNQHGNKIQDIDELCLDNINIIEFKPICFMFTNYLKIKCLTLNNCFLRTLDELPQMLEIEIMEITKNQIYDKQLKFMGKFRLLTHLSLDQNHLNHASSFSQFKCLPNLQQLELKQNPIESNPKYRHKIFEILPWLKIISCQNRQGDIIGINQELCSSDNNNIDDFDDNSSASMLSMFVNKKNEINDQWESDDSDQAMFKSRKNGRKFIHK